MSRKKRNKYFFKEKTLIRLRMKNDEIRDAIRSQGWIELEEPIHNGYYAEWVLRDDILRRDDVAAFQEALDVCKDKLWGRNPEFRYKNTKTKKWEFAKPKLKSINKERYEALSPSGKKLFYEDTTKSSKYWRVGYTDKKYRCTLSYELVVKITKAYITHRREHDGVLYQMDGENKKMMYKVAGNDNPWGSSSGNSRFWRKHENKKEKLQAERKIVETVKAYKSLDDKPYKKLREIE
jgi:hypothetical protein